MSNALSPQLLAQLFAQESDDAFLVLLTMTHPSFSKPVRLVNNSVDVLSRDDTYEAFPFTIKLPTDDGETVPQFEINFDNVSLELIDEIRSVTDAIGVKLEMILGSMPDVVQMTQDDLKIQSVTYTATQIQAKVILDNFLNTDMTSERYIPLYFPGIF